ncbi:hypothetical protein Neosp_003167 [[Neocosmospora] mangrovei]
MAGLYFIKSGLDKTWHQQMSRRLAWLRDLGVMGMVHLHPLPDGLLGFHGMPLENAAGCLPSNAGPELVALALRDPRNHPLMGGYITLLRCRDPYTHVAWGEALDRLVALCGATTRASDVSYVLSEAEASYLTDRNQLFRFIHIAKEDYRHVLNQDEPVRAWLAQCMARMFGVQAPSQPDMNWWPRVREHVALGDDETFFSLTDLAWRRLLEAVSHADSGFHEKAEMGAKKVVNLVGKFLQHEKNKLVWELLNGHYATVHAIKALTTMSETSLTLPQGPPGFGNCPAVSRPWLERMVAILETRGLLSHVAWKKALNEMRELLLLPECPSPFVPLQILSVAKKACDEDFEHFGDFIHQAEANPALLVNNQRPVSAWSAQCMARMVGFEAIHEDDSGWWMASATRALIKDLDNPDVYIRIHFARDEISEAHHHFYALGDIEKGRKVALKGLHHMEAFIHLHQNGRVLALVGSHIEELRKFIQAKGLEGHLPSSY